MAELAIDFGTSNSAAGIPTDSGPRLIELEPGRQTLPTALFFDFEDRTASYGTDQTGLQFDRALSGRPVRFHHDAGRDAQAAEDLRQAYDLAGFSQVRFMNEPEAAARASLSSLPPGATGLVVDIGGGTSDFTVFRAGPSGDIDILRSTGLRLGGTDFDRMISIHHIMPLAGRGSLIRHAFGSGTHTAPNAIFNDLATWQKIPFLYTPDTRRTAKDLLSYAQEPDKIGRLLRVLTDERGHDLAFAVEAAKIALNTDAAQAQVDLSALEARYTHPLGHDDLKASLTEPGQDIARAALGCVSEAGLDIDQIGDVICVGGSSLMQVVRAALTEAFPAAKLREGAALTGIIEGLAMAAAR